MALFALFGSLYVNPANWHPFIPANTGHFGDFGWSGIFTASGVIVFAYIGFDAISTCAQEARNPARDLPISILSSLAICTVLYMGTSIVLTGMVMPALARRGGRSGGRRWRSASTRIW